MRAPAASRSLAASYLLAVLALLGVVGLLHADTFSAGPAGAAVSINANAVHRDPAKAASADADGALASRSSVADAWQAQETRDRAWLQALLARPADAFSVPSGARAP